MKLHNISRGKTGSATWGCYWKKGELKASDNWANGIKCIGESKNEVAMQSRITAYWPDGSIKWTAHTADCDSLGNSMEVIKGESAISYCSAVTEKDNKIIIEKGTFKLIVDKTSGYLFDEMIVDGQLAMSKAKPKLILEHPVEQDGASGVIRKTYEGKIDSVTVEEAGDILTVIKYEGTHEGKIPYVIRLMIEPDLANIKLMHTFFYDGDENTDFLKGIGVSVCKPMAGNVYNRHVKMAQDAGIFHEVSLPLMSWRPRIERELYVRQMNGEELHEPDITKDIIEQVIPNAPAWDTYSICQDSATHFCIKKKQDYEGCYIESLHGMRSGGVLAAGSETGSIMVGNRDFWQKYPAGIDISGLTKDEMNVDIWFYSPKAEAFDFRHYAPRGYNQVCYEGYDYKGADADGIALTSEAQLTYYKEMIPSDDKVKAYVDRIEDMPLYVADPEFYHENACFGTWSLADRSTELGSWLEDQLDNAFEFYKKEVDQRGWYGIFNYGDFMHSYDDIRHQWKYDIGGYAWDNTELVPTLWLWYFFLRSGRSDVFALAQKLSRHASEVDVYHFGKYKGLGTRHNVRHWGCPCKEARIAMAAHHRVYYYLTGDRRLEDIFDELKDNELSFLNKDPLGDFFDKKDMVFPSHARSGPDWSSLCSNWMTEWERHNDTKYRDKILIGIEDIAKTPLKLSSGPDFEFDPATCHLRYIGERTTGGCHLQVCMGAPSVWIEMAELLEHAEFKDMLVGLGRFAYLDKETRDKETNGLIGKREYTFPFMFSGIAAYAGMELGEDWLKNKVWQVLLSSLMTENNKDGFVSRITKDAGNKESLCEIPWISTNFVAQWCLNTIMALDMVRDALPKTLKGADELINIIGEGGFHKA